MYGLVAMVTDLCINVQVVVMEMSRNENLRFLPFIWYQMQVVTSSGIQTP